MREAQCGTVSRWRGTWAIPLVAICMAAALSAPAFGTVKYGPVQISGNFETQNLVRDPKIDQYQFVQNRNTFRFRFEWDWLQNGKLIDRIDLPFIQSSKIFVLYRGVYDGIYDIVPRDNQKGQTRFDDLVGGRIGDLSADEKTGFKFENRLREAYLDLRLKDAPVSFRLGRQQVIWGESDQFRIMDIWNPLDITWHFQQESWDNIRIPLWLGKGLWDIGEVGPLSNSFLEVVYNPFDFQPGIKAGFLPQPWALPFPDPLRTGQIQNATGTSPSANPLLLSPAFDLQGTSLRRGDFHRNIKDASEVGGRFHAVTPQGFEFSLNYLYGRGRGVGAASPFAVKIESVNIPKAPRQLGGRPDVIGQYLLNIDNPNGAPVDVIPVNVKAKVIHPYMNIFGMTGNYFEGDYTQTVFRLESAYAMGEPFQTTDPKTLAPVTFTNSRGVVLPFGGATSPLGFTKRDVWTGMLGFDRPTWIKFLNPTTTWFLTGQFFFNYTTGGHIDQLVGNAGAGDSPYFGPLGKWVSVTDPSKNAGLVNKIERQQNAAPGSVGNGDNIRQWEHLVTFAATSFYRGGTIVPFIADAWDFVNGNNEFLWNVDYFYTNNFIISLQQKFFMTYGSNATSNDPWYAGGRFSRRDETGLKLTYQF